jgi:hypothetical protein
MVYNVYLIAMELFDLMLSSLTGISNISFSNESSSMYVYVTPVIIMVQWILFCITYLIEYSLSRIFLDFSISRGYDIIFIISILKVID